MGLRGYGRDWSRRRLARRPGRGSVRHGAGPDHSDYRCRRRSRRSRLSRRPRPLLVWNRASGEQAHQLIRLLTGRQPSEYWGRSREPSSDPQICYIARLVWHRASAQRASELIRALEILPVASPPRRRPKTYIRGLLQSEDQAPWNPSQRSRRAPVAVDERMNVVQPPQAVAGQR